MKKEIILILALALLLIISFIAFSNKPIVSGKIYNIHFSTGLVSFDIENKHVLAFTNFLNLKDNETISVYGELDENNKSVIIADRIERIK